MKANKITKILILLASSLSFSTVFADFNCSKPQRLEGTGGYKNIFHFSCLNTTPGPQAFYCTISGAQKTDPITLTLENSYKIQKNATLSYFNNPAMTVGFINMLAFFPVGPHDKSTSFELEVFSDSQNVYISCGVDPKIIKQRPGY